MNKNVKAGGRSKKRKLYPLLRNQSLITKFFVSSTNQADEDEVVYHRRNKLLIVEDEEDDSEQSSMAEDDEVVYHRRNPLLIVLDEEENDFVVHDSEQSSMAEDDEVVDDEEEVQFELSSKAEDVVVHQARPYKYAKTTFYKLIASFYENSTYKLVKVPKSISTEAIKLLYVEIPNIKKTQAFEIIKNCGMQCRGYINISNGTRTSLHSAFKKIKNDRLNPIHNPINCPRNNPKNNLRRQQKIAEENYLALMEMFRNGLIREMPLSDNQIKEVVDSLFINYDILNDSSVSIYTGYTGCSLTDEPYRYYI